MECGLVSAVVVSTVGTSLGFHESFVAAALYPRARALAPRVLNHPAQCRSWCVAGGRDANVWPRYGAIYRGTMRLRHAINAVRSKGDRQPAGVACNRRLQLEVAPLACGPLPGFPAATPPCGRSLRHDVEGGRPNLSAMASRIFGLAIGRPRQYWRFVEPQPASRARSDDCRLCGNVCLSPCSSVSLPVRHKCLPPSLLRV